MKDQQEPGAKESETEEDANEDKQSSGIRLGRRRKSLASGSSDPTIHSGFTAEHVTKLRVSIQSLCRATNPLGKCIEFAYEDMDAMTRELAHWELERVASREKYLVEKSKTEKMLEPLVQELREVEAQMKDEHLRIGSLKSNLTKHDERIHQLLQFVIS